MPPDTVTVWNSNTKKSQSYRGRIVSYDASELKLQLASGREQSLPSAQITDITSRWHDDYVKAEDFVQQRRFERASISYKQALTAETRLWVKHRITARLVACEQNEGNWHNAANQFFNTLMSQQSGTPY